MEKVTFTPNVPQQIALRFPDGKLTEGRFGDQMFYPTSTGKAMYLGLDVAQKLNLLGLQKNEPFWICKRWSGTKGDPVQWDLRRLQPGEQIPATATGIDPTALEADIARQRQLQQQASPRPTPPQSPQPVYPGAGRPGASVLAPPRRRLRLRSHHRTTEMVAPTGPTGTPPMETTESRCRMSRPASQPRPLKWATMSPCAAFCAPPWRR